MENEGRKGKKGREAFSTSFFCNLSTGAGFVTQTNSVKELKEKALTTVTGWHRSTSCTIKLLVEGALLGLLPLYGSLTPLVTTPVP